MLVSNCSERFSWAAAIALHVTHILPQLNAFPFWAVVATSENKKRSRKKLVDNISSPPADLDLPSSPDLISNDKSHSLFWFMPYQFGF